MCAKTARRRLAEQFLGEIDTEIVGGQYYDAAIQAGERVNLEREPENEHDNQAIRVENGRFEPVGHLPRAMAAWLAKLMDSGKLRLDGYVPAAVAPPDSSTANCPLRLMVFLAPKGQRVMERSRAETPLDVVHQLVLRAYEDVQDACDPEVVLGLSERLEPLARQDLLPQTRLLLALLPTAAREVRSAKGFEAVALLHGLMKTLIVGDPIACNNLTVFPLIWPKVEEPGHVLLSKAIETGTAAVEEVSQAGSVPVLQVQNKCLRPLLILEGEILCGAKQDRVVNLTVLVKAKSRFKLPVSCVEQGRWQYKSHRFRSQFYAPPSLRAKKNKSVQENRARRGEPASDQHEVWDEVARTLRAAKADSSTQALSDAIERARKQVASYGAACQLPQDAAGVAVGCGPEIVGVDLFDCPATLSATWPRLSEAYFLDALRRPAKAGLTPQDHIERFLRAATDGARARQPAAGLGEELEVAGETLIGNALIYANRVCHFSAFSTGGADQGSEQE